MARVGIQVVRPEPRPHQLGCRIALEDGPLARAEHADGGGSLVLQHPLGLRGHGIEGFLPADRGELAVLGIDPVLLAQQGLGQAVLAIHDLGQEIALDAVQAPVHLGQQVAMGGDDPALLDAHHDAAAGAAKAAGRLGPGDLQGFDAAGDRLGICGKRDIGGHRSDSRRLRLSRSRREMVMPAPPSHRREGSVQRPGWPRTRPP